MVSSQITKSAPIARISTLDLQLTSFGILLVFWIIGSFADRAGSLSRFFKYLSLIEHLNDFTRGVIVVKDVVYYLSFTFICVFFTIKSVESAKWK